MRLFPYLVPVSWRVPEIQYSLTILSPRSFLCHCFHSYLLLILFSLFTFSRIPIVCKFSLFIFIFVFFFWFPGERLTFALLIHQFDLIRCPICYSLVPLTLLIWQAWFSFPSSPPMVPTTFPFNLAMVAASSLVLLRIHIFHFLQ